METISFCIELEEGWEIVQKGITKVINIIEGVPDESPMDADYWMNLYTTVFNMCSHIPGHGYSEELYERYQGLHNDYLQSKVLPAIQEKQDDASMLQELVKRWANHKVLVRKLCRLFSYLDSKYVHRCGIPSLKDVGFSCFRKIVYENMKVKVKDPVILLINREREGNEIDRTLVKDVLGIFVEIGSENAKDKLNYYVNDFETAFLTDMVDYYTRTGSNEIAASECFQREKDRVSHYLHSSTEERVLKQVRGQGVA
ncbi:cullin-1-like [Papaver somniferum]|uniref:cullin-1-like n=1 Tax=Papaver somniferum TaxID=3469 RepID=UPI000E702C31|nr:cullin-1-like [Papaver somniferum]